MYQTNTCVAPHIYSSEALHLRSVVRCICAMWQLWALRQMLCPKSPECWSMFAEAIFRLVLLLPLLCTLPKNVVLSTTLPKCSCFAYICPIQYARTAQYRRPLMSAHTNNSQRWTNKNWREKKEQKNKILRPNSPKREAHYIIIFYLRLHHDQGSP